MWKPEGTWIWALAATFRMRAAVRVYWKRILIGAFVGWLLAVVGGAFALASLEVHQLITPTTSNDLGVIIVLYGVGIGALNAYVFRPQPTRR